MGLGIDANEIDITNRLHLGLLISEIEGSQNIQRKKESFIAFECQEGRQKDHVKDRLAALYPETHQKFRVGNVAIVNKIIKKKAKAYKNQPIRKLKTERETKELNKIYDNYKFSRAFKEADKIYNREKYVCLWLSYENPLEGSEELKGTYNLQALAPYEYDLVRDDKGVPKIFILSYSGTDVTKGADGIEQTISEDQRDTSAETKRYSIWTKDYFVKVVARGKGADKPTLEYVEMKANPIKKLPIAFLSQDTSADYPIPSSLADRAIDWNVEFSDLKTAASTQGHGQLVIKHSETIKLRQLHMGMHTAINLPQPRKPEEKPTEADYISANPDLAGQLDVLKFSLVQILDDEGISTKSAIGGGVDEVKSGFDRLLKEADVQDSIEDNQELYTDCLEQEVYLCLKAYEDALNQNTFSSDSLEVTFEKPKVLISDKETLENIRTREELGLLLSYEKHMIINPNLDETKAKKREEDIQAEKVDKVKRMQSLLGDSEEVEDDEELEEDAT